MYFTVSPDVTVSAKTLNSDYCVLQHCAVFWWKSLHVRVYVLDYNSRCAKIPHWLQEENGPLLYRAAVTWWRCAKTPHWLEQEFREPGKLPYEEASTGFLSSLPSSSSSTPSSSVLHVMISCFKLLAIMQVIVILPMIC